MDLMNFKIHFKKSKNRRKNILKSNVHKNVSAYLWILHYFYIHKRKIYTQIHPTKSYIWGN